MQSEQCAYRSAQTLKLRHDVIRQLVVAALPLLDFVRQLLDLLSRFRSL